MRDNFDKVAALSSLPFLISEISELSFMISELDWFHLSQTKLISLLHCSIGAPPSPVQWAPAKPVSSRACSGGLACSRRNLSRFLQISTVLRFKQENIYWPQCWSCWSWHWFDGKRNRFPVYNQSVLTSVKQLRQFQTGWIGNQIIFATLFRRHWHCVLKQRGKVCSGSVYCVFLHLQDPHNVYKCYRWRKTLYKVNVQKCGGEPIYVHWNIEN